LMKLTPGDFQTLRTEDKRLPMRRAIVLHRRGCTEVGFEPCSSGTTSCSPSSLWPHARWNLQIIIIINLFIFLVLFILLILINFLLISYSYYYYHGWFITDVTSFLILPPLISKLFNYKTTALHWRFAK